MYTVQVTKSAERELAGCPARVRIVKKIGDLQQNPRPAWATKLVGEEAWRFRVGDYRVLYTIEDRIRVVTVTKIGHRRDVYRRR